jgi:ferredoxin
LIARVLSFLFDLTNFLRIFMPKINIKTDRIVKDVADDSALIETCQGTSILFGCGDGSCGSCLIRVLKGADALSKMGQDEAEFLELLGSDSSERLACQCRVRGDVEIEVAD